MKLRRLLIGALCAFIVALSVTFAVREISLFGSLDGHTGATTKQLPALVRALRPNYPYSVIPGGAYSSAELRYANKKDEVVRVHYADFDLQAARIVQLTEDRYQYVSYRLQNKIYWTHKTLRIPKGEYLLTDGHTYARTRCGNRLSDKSHRQTCPQEPYSALSLPPLRLDMLPNLELAAAPPPGELAQQFPILPDTAERLAAVLPNGALATIPTEQTAPLSETYVPVPPIFPASPPSPTALILPPPIGLRPQGSPPRNFPAVPVPIPEPSTIYLFVITFFVSLWGLARMIPKKDEADASGTEAHE